MSDKIWEDAIRESKMYEFGMHAGHKEKGFNSQCKICVQDKLIRDIRELIHTGDNPTNDRLLQYFYDGYNSAVLDIIKIIKIL